MKEGPAHKGKKRLRRKMGEELERNNTASTVRMISLMEKCSQCGVSTAPKHQKWKHKNRKEMERQALRLNVRGKSYKGNSRPPADDLATDHGVSGRQG